MNPQIQITSENINSVHGKQLQEEWDYVITVCDEAKETCPLFTGNVKQQLHMGFEDPSHATGTDEYIQGEHRRIRDEIKSAFYKFYLENLKI